LRGAALNMAIQLMKITNKKLRHFRMPVIAFILAGVATGCSSIPDGINPMEWFNNSLELFSNKNPKASQKQVKVTTQAPVDVVSDKKTRFPKLGKVDQQQQNAAVRGKGLVADIEGRKYAPAIARQSEATNVLSVAPSRPSKITAAKMPVAKPKTSVLALPTSDLPAPAKLKPTLSSGVPGQDDFQARFANRLAEIRAQAAKSNKITQYSVPISNQISIGTVVVSSSGIKSNYDVLETKYVQSADTVNSKSTYRARPMARVLDNVVRVATIRFKNGSSKLSSRDRQILAKVIRLKKERGGRIHVVGHASSRTQNTDLVSHKMINFRVSAARADVVARELQRLGADKSQLQIDAVSDNLPEYLEIMPTGEAGNRRAEIYLDS
jgi:flagellar motor protein MotB